MSKAEKKAMENHRKLQEQLEAGEITKEELVEIFQGDWAK